MKTTTAVQNAAGALEKISTQRRELIDQRGELADAKQRILTQLALTGPEPGEKQDLENQLAKTEKQLETISADLLKLGLQEDGVVAEQARLREEDKQHRTQQLEERYHEITETLFLKMKELEEQAAGYARLCREYMDLSGQPGVEAGKFGITLQEAGLKEFRFQPYHILLPLQEAFDATGIRNIGIV